MARIRKTKAGTQRTLHEAGFTGDGRNMRGRTNVPCRIMNDWAGLIDHSAELRRDGEPHRVYVGQTLGAMDFMNPGQSGRFLPDPPSAPDVPSDIAAAWHRMSA